MAKRPNILKLATKISLESMTYTGITYNDPEYKILEPIIDDEMCAIMMHLRLEANRTVEDVAKRARKSVEYTQEQLDKLCKTGAVRYRYVDGKRCYFYPARDARADARQRHGRHVPDARHAGDERDRERHAHGVV